MQVLHVLPDLKVGGGQQLVLSLAEHADRRDVQVCVAYMTPDHEMRPRFEEAGVVPRCLNHQSGWRWLLTLVRLVRLIRSEGVDVLHAHSSPDKKLAYAAAALTRTPVVSHLHMPRRYRQQERSIAARLRAWIRSRAGRLVVGRFVAVSRAVMDAHAPFLPDPGRLRLVLNGIPTDRFLHGDASQLQALRVELGVNGAFPVLINVGRLHPQKDQMTLVRMMSTIREARPEAKLLIVGEGPERGPLQQEIHARGVQDAVLLVGERHDIPELLAIADVFVLSSRAEGFGIVVAEAMAAEKPVVAFDLEPLREFVEDGRSGYLVTARSPEALAAAALKVVDDSSLRSRMGARGRQIVLERFDISVCVRQLETIYRSVLRRPAA
jgi:glycosyltransferase involved in cell wall biosynthesis